MNILVGDLSDIIGDFVNYATLLRLLTVSKTSYDKYIKFSLGLTDQIFIITINRSIRKHDYSLFTYLMKRIFTSKVSKKSIREFTAYIYRYGTLEMLLDILERYAEAHYPMLLSSSTTAFQLSQYDNIIRIDYIYYVDPEIHKYIDAHANALEKWTTQRGNIMHRFDLVIRQGKQCSYQVLKEIMYNRRIDICKYAIDNDMVINLNWNILSCDLIDYDLPELIGYYKHKFTVDHIEYAEEERMMNYLTRLLND